MSAQDLHRRVYLAGPDVFLPDALEVLAQKKAVCARHGLVGVTPLDNEVAIDPDAVAEAAQRIYEANRDYMRSCFYCIANATPFRGVSIDAGTAFEIGYMCALGHTVFAYSTEPQTYEARTHSASRTDPLVGRHVHGGFMVERFGLCENLMIPFGVLESGGEIIVPQEGEPAEEAALFEACVKQIAARQG